MVTYRTAGHSQDLSNSAFILLVGIMCQESLTNPPKQHPLKMHKYAKWV
jgi:hypothetical protein